MTSPTCGKCTPCSLSVSHEFETVKSMSVQFGKCNFDGRPVDPQELEEVRPMLAPYGPDGEGYICEGNFGILYRAFYTTKESRREIQPYVSVSGVVISWVR